MRPIICRIATNGFDCSTEGAHGKKRVRIPVLRYQHIHRKECEKIGLRSHKIVSNLFEHRDDGLPLLSEKDESTITSGMYLCGPTVRHDNLVFCFIYKYRQRFAVVAKAIATSLGLPAEDLESYRQWGMYLDDLSCCGEECETC